MSKSIRCQLEVDVHAVTCPGVWFPCKSPVYLSICFLGFHVRTKPFPANFPLLFNDKFVFEKTFPGKIFGTYQKVYVIYIVQILNNKRLKIKTRRDYSIVRILGIPHNIRLHNKYFQWSLTVYNYVKRCCVELFQQTYVI